MYDVAIVGGSAAGLSAALTLGRFRRKVVIFDDQKPRNQPAEHAHNFFTRDGTPPSELLAIGRKQLEPYTTVTLQTTRIAHIESDGAGFRLESADGATHHAKRILLATGVRDQHLPIAGLEQFWGKSVYHCPYCHGWEVRDQPVVIIGSGEGIVHLATLLAPLAATLTGCVYGDPTLSSEQRADLAQLGVTIHTDGIVAIEGEGQQVHGVRLQSGELVSCEAVFAVGTEGQASQLSAELNCDHDENGFVAIDELGRTSIPNVYAAGDMTTRFQQIIVAAASGMAAAAGINTDIAFGE